MYAPPYARTLGRPTRVDERRDVDSPREVVLPIVVHPRFSPQGIIVINYPGYGGSIDGYNGKHRALAEHLQKTFTPVIRTSNQVHNGLNYRTSVQRDLETVIDHATMHAEEICGRKDPILYLMGFSAGASAIAAVAHKYPRVQKILLIAPSNNAGEKAVAEGLERFRGEVYVVGAANDDVVGPDAAPRIFSMTKSARTGQLVILKDCDHQFRGTENGKIISKAPKWAFCGDNSFPSPDGGIVLY